MEWSKLPILQLESDVKQLCTTLIEKTPVKFFHYMKSYENGAMATLCTNSHWLEHYYSEQYYKISTFRNSPANYDEQYFLTSALQSSRPIVRDALEGFEIGSGIALVYPSKDHVETFLFCTGTNSEDPYQFFFNHLDILKNFVLFFRDQGRKLLDEASKNRILLPLPREKTTLIRSKNEVNFPVKRYYINDETYLTSKEIDCLRYLAEGKSHEEIGLILNNSKRTIDVHVDNLKNKFNTFKSTSSNGVCIGSTASGHNFLLAQFATSGALL